MPDTPPADSLPVEPARNSRRARKHRWPRIVVWTLASLLLLLLLAAGAGVLWLRSAALASLPQLDGDVHLAGLSAPVIVERDAHGVPHISAATQDDLFVAQGYVTAQDRLWQMDSLRRAANGELAEILGHSLVEYDKTQRVLQIRLTAQRVYDHLQAGNRARLEDYARGVNLFIAQCERSNTLPVEFRLLRYRPQPWRGVDSISVGLNMVQTLDSHVATKLSRARISAGSTTPSLKRISIRSVHGAIGHPRASRSTSASRSRNSLLKERTTMMRTMKRASCLSRQPMPSRSHRRG